MSDKAPQDELFEFAPTTKFKLIYIFAIGDERHEGCLKIGDATLMTSKPFNEIIDNSKELNDAAIARIQQYTTTAGVPFKLLHTELAVRERVTGGGSAKTVYLESFKDTDVHAVLEATGIVKKVFSGTKCRDWYVTDLPTAKAAIAAYKHFHRVLGSHEITHEDPPVVLRDEQNEAVEKTLERFKKKNDMLWDAKMRFGKTLTALEVIRRSHQKDAYPKPFRRVLIATHRPVVSSGWGEDFKKTFRKTDPEYEFIDKSTLGGNSYSKHEQSENDRALRALDKKGKNFIYFASVQDLRGSQVVGGSFPKNVAVFEIDWDLIIIDEAHEGLQTELGDKVTKRLIKKNTRVLSLSGTPFNILGQFEDEAVYTWDYIAEQKRKETWDEDHPGEPNPYADMPQMHILTYDIGEAMQDFTEEDLEGKAFNFREFFRTWTGDATVDHRKMPQGARVGDFVHESDVKAFLDLLAKEDKNSRYPFSTREYRALFKHTLWMIPGVKEAKALSKMMKDHPVFGSFGIANVAGEGDDFEDSHREEALKLVKDTIAKHEYSITLSCGKLTTGVTVREWTAVMMLTGSTSTAAAGYMQTIFRVQSAGSIDGKQKTDCYVFDFAPDRALRVLAETARVSCKVSKNDAAEKHGKQVLGEFLNFCPVIAINGSKMRSYDVKTMMASIKHIFVMKAIRNGFDDSSIYSDKLLQLGKVDLKKFEALRAIVGTTKQTERADTVILDDQGFDEEEHETGLKLSPKELTEAEKAERAERKKRKEEKKRAISILRAISIRMPLLIYGADVEVDKAIKITDFVKLVDQESWDEFMPQGVTKELFSQFVEYYDADVFETAGLEIRRLAKAADKLPPTQRVMQIARIFSYFKNPDKETVLTPWRVVNMHMSDTLGGWCFWDKKFEKPLDDGPRFTVREGVTKQVFDGEEAKVLEINSKSGLYPLYVAYSLYRTSLGAVPEEDITQKARLKIWNDVVARALFVICKTPMAVSITRRTLVGYTGAIVNAKFFENITEALKDGVKKFVEKATNNKYWGKGSGEMKFQVIVGNPPYQKIDGGHASSALPVYQEFVSAGKQIDPSYLSMIIPARWFSGGRGLDKFREEMLADSRLRKIFDFVDSTECFPQIDLAGGVCYFLWDRDHAGDCQVTSHLNGEVSEATRPLLEKGCDSFIRFNQAVSILKKVSKGIVPISKIMTANDPFGYDVREEGSYRRVKPSIKDKPFANAVTIHYYGKEGKSKGYVARASVRKNADLVDKMKVFISASYGERGDYPYQILGKPFYAGKGVVCTETYLCFGPFASKKECDNLAAYVQTRLFRFLVMLKKQTQHAPPQVYQFVPMQDFSESWDDAKLYKKYGITKDEQKFIESMIKPMA